MHISMAFLNMGDGVLIPNPGYPTYGAVSKLLGAEIFYYNLSEENNWYPKMDDLERLNPKNIKLMWINYPHMPTGADFEEKKLIKLISWAKKNDIIFCISCKIFAILSRCNFVFFPTDQKKRYV